MMLSSDNYWGEAMSIVIMLILLSILILVHEAGHYLAARMFGMKVDKFGFGLPIGPTLWEKQCGDTKVLVHAFLLGGYVAFPDDDKDNPLPEDSPDRFLNRPIYQRFVVVSAGVFANVVCAFVLVLLTAFLWGHMPSGKYDIFVKNIVAEKSQSVWSSGLQKGDKIVSVNGVVADTAGILTTYAKLSKAYDGKVDASLVEKNLDSLTRLNVAFKRDEIIPQGTVVRLPEKIYESPIHLSAMVLRGLEKYQDNQNSLSDAQKKLRDEFGDKNYYISTGDVTLTDIAYAYSDSLRPVNIEVLRDDKTVTLKPVYPNKEGLIGVELELREIVIPTKSPKSAIKASCKYMYEQTYMLLYGLWQIFSGKMWVWGFLLLQMLSVTSVWRQIYCGKTKADEKVWVLLKNPNLLYFVPVVLFGGLVFSYFGLPLKNVWLGLALVLMLIVANPLAKLEQIYAYDKIQKAAPCSFLFEVLLVFPVRILGRVLWLLIDFVFIERTIINTLRRLMAFLVKTVAILHVNMFVGAFIFTFIGGAILIWVYYFNGGL